MEGFKREECSCGSESRKVPFTSWSESRPLIMVCDSRCDRSGSAILDVCHILSSWDEPGRGSMYHEGKNRIILQLLWGTLKALPRTKDRSTSNTSEQQQVDAFEYYIMFSWSYSPFAKHNMITSVLLSRCLTNLQWSACPLPPGFLLDYLLCLPYLICMEEVWKDISLSTLHQDVPSTPLLSFHHHHHRTFHTSNPTTTSSFGGITLEDFLADAPKEATRVPPPSSRPPASIDPSPDNSVRFFGYDLNTSACDCKISGSSFNDAHSECTKKRSPEQQPNRSIDGQDGAERRKKRIIKNRESAARSRARKQVLSLPMMTTLKWVQEF